MILSSIFAETSKHSFDNCSICLDTLEGTTIFAHQDTTIHAIHESCLKQLQQQCNTDRKPLTCPLCRQKITIQGQYVEKSYSLMKCSLLGGTSFLLGTALVVGIFTGILSGGLLLIILIVILVLLGMLGLLLFV